MRVKRWLWIIVSIAAVVFVAKYLLLDTPAAPGPKFVIDIEALHKVATSAGPLPDHDDPARFDPCHARILGGAVPRSRRDRHVYRFVAVVLAKRVVGRVSSRQ